MATEYKKVAIPFIDGVMECWSTGVLEKPKTNEAIALVNGNPGPITPLLHIFLERILHVKPNKVTVMNKIKIVCSKKTGIADICGP